MSTIVGAKSFAAPHAGSPSESRKSDGLYFPGVRAPLLDFSAVDAGTMRALLDGRVSRTTLRRSPGWWRLWLKPQERVEQLERATLHVPVAARRLRRDIHLLYPGFLDAGLNLIAVPEASFQDDVIFVDPRKARIAEKEATDHAARNIRVKHGADPRGTDAPGIVLIMGWKPGTN